VARRRRSPAGHDGGSGGHGRSHAGAAFGGFPSLGQIADHQFSGPSGLSTVGSRRSSLGGSSNTALHHVQRWGATTARSSFELAERHRGRRMGERLRRMGWLERRDTSILRTMLSVQRPHPDPDVQSGPRSTAATNRADCRLALGLLWAIANTSSSHMKDCS
jgi:hypothetical protein